MTPHYVVFSGASSSLSDELMQLRSRISGARVVAKAVKQTQRGLTNASIERAARDLVEAIENDGEPDTPARLSVWGYAPIDPNIFQLLWNVFGRSAWVELVPIENHNKDRPTRLFIEERIAVIESLVHEISEGVTNRRKTSPLPMPLTNFRSRVLEPYRGHWYGGLSLQQLKDKVRTIHDRFRERHTHPGPMHADERNLLFSPAHSGACHAVPHPTGDKDICYVNGRFRFGAAIHRGHHYDVRQQHGTLTCTLYDCAGQPRDLAPEKRDYINVFPNEHLLPTHHR